MRVTKIQSGEVGGYDMFRLSKSKQVVDICANTLRTYHRAGLPFYRNGKAVFISKGELAAFIRSNATPEAIPSHAVNL